MNVLQKTAWLPSDADPNARGESSHGRASAWTGAILAVLGSTLVVFALTSYDALAAPAPNPAAAAALAGLALLAALYGGAVVLQLWVVRLLPAAFLWTLAACGFVLAVIFAFEGVYRATLGLPVLFAAGSLVGAGGAALLRRRGSRPRQRAVGAASLVAGAALFAPIAWWLAWPGPGPRPSVAEALGAVDAEKRLDTSHAASDPSQRGPHAVRRLSYGSGRDRTRREFAASVDVRAPSVDGSMLLPTWSGVVGRSRTSYWGFDARALPLQGLVFFPEGPAPAGEAGFPLVLLMHGHRSAEKSSHRGLAYLAEHLASRGAVAVSVDANFLNYSLADVLGGLALDLTDDLDARAWLLLEHLRLWRDWTRDPAHPVAGRVDMSRVVLVGHSRGGEAAALAALFNRLPTHPSDGRVEFDYRFAIRGVVGLAPPDRTVLPGGRPARLEDMDYLVLHGSQDAGVPSFIGWRQYQRVGFTGGDWFKAGVYVRGANHSQFNSDWEDDRAFPTSLFVNHRALLSRDDQERIARTFVGAFLEAVVHGRDEYRAVFRDWRSAPGWLPRTDYIQQYMDSKTLAVATFEEDLDLATASLPRVRAAGRGLTEWREGPLPMRAGASETRMVVLGWSRGPRDETPAYALTFADPAVTEPETRLTFHLSDLRGAGQPLELSIEVGDRRGEAARLPLGRSRPLLPPIRAHVLKAAFLDPRPPFEPVLQHFEMPLSEFRTINPRLDLRALASVRFVFDGTPSGRVALDDVGLR